jgi:hypothetical protein
MPLEGLSTLLTASASYTARDYSITGNGARDPMGFEALWSFLGREVFDNKITSIANDVRNYTVALLHHAVVRKLQDEGSFSRVQELLQKEEGRRSYSEKEVVGAIIIFLENLLIYAMVRGDNHGREVRTAGMLGVFKGMNALFEKIWISQRKEAFVLVNQANVGLNARYKTPFIRMELFDEYYRYEFRRLKHEGIWKEIEQFPQDFTRLRDTLVSLIREMVCRRSVSLTITLEKPPRHLPEVVDGYRRLFASPDMERYREIVAFWKRHLGFHESPAIYLYTSMREVIAETEETSDAIPYREVFRRAEEKAWEKEDKRSATRFRAILETESVLAPLRYVFDLLLTGSYRNLENEELLSRASAAMGRVKSNARPELQHYFANSSEYVRERVEQLIERVAKVNDPHTFMREILAYHKKITEERKNVPWVREETGRLELLAGSIVRRDKMTTVYDWYHSYYLDSLLSILRGFAETGRERKEEMVDAR